MSEESRLSIPVLDMDSQEEESDIDLDTTTSSIKSQQVSNPSALNEKYVYDGNVIQSLQSNASSSSRSTNVNGTNSSSRLPLNKENTKCTPSMSKLPVSTRKFTSGQKSFNSSEKKLRSASGTKKQPLALVNKQ